MVVANLLLRQTDERLQRRKLHKGGRPHAGPVKERATRRCAVTSEETKVMPVGLMRGFSLWSGQALLFVDGLDRGRCHRWTSPRDG